MFTVWQIDPAQLTPYYNIAVCNALAQQGCHVRYVTSRYLYDPNLPIPDTFETDYLYFRGLDHQWLLCYPRLRKGVRALSYVLGHLTLLNQIKRHKPDIVHFQWSRLPRLDLWLIRQIQAMNIPVVHTVHDVVPIYDTSAVVPSLAKIYTTVEALIVHAEANRENFLSVYPAVNPQRVHILPMIVQENISIPIGGDQRTARIDLGLPEDAPIILFFGGIKPYKGLDILVDAFKLALQKCPDLRLMIVGHAEDHRRDLPPALLDEVIPNILLKPEYVPTDEIWKYHLAADVIVFPYRHIYQSAALNTAMGYGRAVIVTNVGGLPEVIDGNGWIVPSEDAKALSETLIEAVSDKERLRVFGQRSREIHEQIGGSRKVGQMTLALYQEIMSNRTG